MVLQPVFVFLVDALLGNLMMLVISSTAYSLGIGFVTLSTPPVLANSTQTCKQYEPECIGHTQLVLFYTGMALIAVGVAGNSVSIKPFLEEQEDRDGNDMTIWMKIAGALPVVVVALTGAIALPYIKPWTLRFGIPAICTVVAWFLFLTGLCCFQYDIQIICNAHAPILDDLYHLWTCVLNRKHLLCRTSEPFESAFREMKGSSPGAASSTEGGWFCGRY